MYTIVLVIHSWVRWIALIAGVGTTYAALRRQDSTAEHWALAAVTALDLQMLLGLLLYFVVSPNMKEILAHFGDAMKDPAARFYAVEHITGMLLAIVAAHIGRVLMRKAPTPEARSKRLLYTFGISTILMIISMPWPGRPGGRPLFRV
jgi:hypothetical protein